WDMVALLEHLGYKVNYNPAQTCCGMPSFFSGLKDTTREVANKFLEDFNVNSQVVCPSTQCSTMVQKHYDQFFRNTSNHNVYRTLQSRFKEFAQFILGELESETPIVPNKKYYHWASCSGQVECGLDNTVSEFLAEKGLEMLNTKKANGCCGNIGVVSTLHEDLAIEQLEKSLEPVLALNPEVIVFEEPQCQLQLQGYFSKQGIDIECVHLATLLKSMYVK
ncbi:MAG: (Fe-S)-binding protein, partial [Bacteroidetes bacterium]|nr:(Fe-S)-binding protein [Bacteroidota bacterium]